MDQDAKEGTVGGCAVDGAESDIPLIRWMDVYFTGEVCLRKIVRRLYEGATSVEELPIDPASIDPAMDAFERAVVEHHDKILAGTAIGGPLASDEVIADVRRLRGMTRPDPRWRWPGVGRMVGMAAATFSAGHRQRGSGRARSAVGSSSEFGGLVHHRRPRQ